MKTKDLIERRAALRTDAQALLDAAGAENRGLSAEEQARFDGLMGDIETLTGSIERLTKFEADERSAERALNDYSGGKREARGGEFINLETGKRAAVRLDEQFAAHEVVAAARAREAEREQAAIATHGNLANQLRALTLTGGAAVVPQVWAAQLIDLARNKSAVMQAGAQVVPMDASVVKIGRLTGDPTAAFRTEGSLITPSDPALDNVTLTAQTMRLFGIKGVARV
ncbi:phage major capsid protein [Pseudarthrobacter oxydans]|uniref:phage major capsid protein n=1 Tax=Pseudarthrobacter oxydans TaxID=1671 RepID=UPI003418171C